jgi:murein DD-endopeptidase MepM/ murein hydrolase activator NlpD
VRHRLADGRYFYALYGHAAPAPDIKDGKDVIANQIIAQVALYLDVDPGTGKKRNISHLHFGVWNSEAMPPVSELGYGTVRHYTDPLRFLREHVPYSGTSRFMLNFEFASTLSGKSH